MIVQEKHCEHESDCDCDCDGDGDGGEEAEVLAYFILWS